MPLVQASSVSPSEGNRSLSSRMIIPWMNASACRHRSTRSAGLDVAQEAGVPGGTVLGIMGSTGADVDRPVSDRGGEQAGPMPRDDWSLCDIGPAQGAEDRGFEPLR